MKVAVALVALAAAITGGIVLSGAGDDDAANLPDGALGGGPTPALFRLSEVVPIPVTPSQTPKKLAGAAEAAADDAVAVMDTIYTEGFLDPANLDGGVFDTAWAQFTEDAAAQARADVDILTAGASAGGTYTSIEPAKATATARVLMDDAGAPLSVMAAVSFTARGLHGDGSFTLFTSTGRFFLRRAGPTWKVVAFDVRRADREKQAPPTPGGSASPGPTESPS